MSAWRNSFGHAFWHSSSLSYLFPFPAIIIWWRCSWDKYFLLTFTASVVERHATFFKVVKVPLWNPVLAGPRCSVICVWIIISCKVPLTLGEGTLPVSCRRSGNCSHTQTSTWSCWSFLEGKCFLWKMVFLLINTTFTSTIVELFTGLSLFVISIASKIPRTKKEQWQKIGDIYLRALKKKTKIGWYISKSIETNKDWLIYIWEHWNKQRLADIYLRALKKTKIGWYLTMDPVQWAARICLSASAWSRFQRTFRRTPRLFWTCCYFLWSSSIIHLQLLEDQLTKTTAVFELFTNPAFWIVTIVDVRTFAGTRHHG